MDPRLLLNNTILVVDDEPEALKGYQEFLTPAQAHASETRKSSRLQTNPSPAANSSKTWQFRILLASSGEQAVEIAAAEKKEGRDIAAGFFDVKLQGRLDGLQTLMEVRKNHPDILCTIVTAYHDRSVEEIDTLFGEDFRDQWDYLNKPFTQAEIFQKACQMISSWNRKRRLEDLHRQLLQSEKMAAIGQVARGIGHEFGNILLRIMGKADLALMQNDIEKIKTDLKIILEASDRAGVIVRNLQSFSKSSQNFEHGSLIKPLDQALSLVNHEFVKANVKLEKKISEIPPTRIDTGGLAQVFLNLMLNAIQAMPAGGTLTVTVRPGTCPDPRHLQTGKNGVLCEIQDTGTGIAADVLPRIFEFAFTTKGNIGSGIGLSISKEIVEAHEGVLTVRSKLDAGSTFSVWIPLVT